MNLRRLLSISLVLGLVAGALPSISFARTYDNAHLIRKSSVGAASIGATGIGTDEKVYIGQKDLDNIAVYDSETLTPLSSSPIDLGAGAQPQELIADTLRPYLYVSDSAQKLIHVINTNFDFLEYSIPVTGSPQGITLSGDGNYLYVATDLRVDKIDTRSRTVIASSPATAPFAPWDIALNNTRDQSGTRVWVTNNASTGEVRSYDPTTMQQFDSIIPAGASSAHGIGPAYGGTVNQAAIADTTNKAFRLFNDSTNVTTTPTTSTAFVAGPWAIEQETAIPAAGTYRWLVTDGGGPGSGTGDSVVEFSGEAPYGETRRISGLGGGASADAPQEIAFSSIGKRAFVTLGATDKVSVINYDFTGVLTESAVISLTGGANPYGIEITDARKPATRFAGADRYKTAAATCQENHGDKSADAVVIASGENFPDGIVAGPLAGILRTCLLLVKKGSLPDATKTEIARIFDSVNDIEPDVYIVGGLSVINSGVEAAIQAIDPDIDTTRAAGLSRYKTSVEVAKAMDTIRGSKPTKVFVARGTDYPDALVVSAVAASSAFNPFFMPIFLSSSDSLDPDVRTYLDNAPTVVEAYLAGGTTALSATVAAQVDAEVPTVTRLGASNRYSTATTIAAFFFPAPTMAAFASGQNFPDALVMGPLAGYEDLSGITASYVMPILLVKSDSIPAETAAYLSTLSSLLRRTFIGGGTTAINNAVEIGIESGYR